MPDPFALSVRAIALHEAWAPALVFACGLLSSIGPCAAPRLVAVAGIASRGSRKDATLHCCAVVAGLVAAYAAFGAASVLLAGAMAASGFLYTGLAVALGCIGFATLWRDGKCHAHRSLPSSQTLGASFLLGGSFALIVSPCCTPLVAAILAYSAPGATPGWACVLLTAFALGHSVVLFAAATGISSASRVAQRYGVEQAARTVSGTLMLALAAFYGALA